MKSIQKKFLILLNAALHAKKIPIQNFSYNELNLFYQMAHIHNIESLIFSSLEIPENLSSDCNKLIQSWNKMTVLSALKQKMNYIHLQEILHAVNVSNLSVIPLKGTYLRMLYPYPDFRTMGDVDLLIHGNDYEAVKKLLLNLKYKEIPDTHPYHRAFTRSNYPPIEVHWALTDKKSFNPLAVQTFENHVWAHALSTYIGEVPSLSFSPEDTCIYLTLHMAKHLTYTGFGLRQLCDLYLLLEQYHNEINWDVLCEMLKTLGLYPFWGLLLTTLHYLFDLPISNLSRNDLPTFDHKIVDFFIHEIFQNGVFGTSSYSHSFSSLLINGEKNTSKQQPTFIKHFLFPPISKLQSRYSYCKKLFFLLPIAWLQNLIHLLLRQDVSFSNKLQALLFSTQNKKRRLQLFKLLEL